MSRLLFAGICLFALCTITIANNKGNDDEAIERGNAYIDQLLKDMFDNGDGGYDPYEMEDSVVGFHKKIMFVNVTGEAKLHNGNIKGLSTLHRPRDCSLHEDGERLKVNADLGAGALDFHYSGSAKFMNFGPTITVQGNLAYVETNLKFTVDAKTGKNGKLEKFTIDDMRGMKVWVTGLGPINWAVNPIISGVTKIFKGFVRNFLENKVQNYIAKRLPNYQFPVEGGEQTESPLTTETEETTQTASETATPQPTQTASETATPEPTQTASETATPEPTQTAEPETVTPEPWTQTPEPETPTPEETETPTPEETETPTPEVTETPIPEETETPTPEETETPTPEETETPTPEEPETTVTKEPETTVPEEPEMTVSEEPETTVSEEPETPVPEELSTPVPDEQNELEEAQK